MPTGVGEGADEVRSLAELSLFLAAFFLDGPDDEKSEVLSDPGWSPVLQRSVISGATTKAIDESLERQRFRFEELLRIPGDQFVSPFEQGYHDRKATVEFSAPAACEQLYRRAGYVKAPYAAVEADHVGHQLRFLSALLQRYAEKTGEGDQKTAAVIQTWIRGFLGDRCWWWPTFSTRLVNKGLPEGMETAVRLLEGLRAWVDDLVHDPDAQGEASSPRVPAS